MNRFFKLFFVALMLTAQCAFAQCPDNIGFEDGTFKNWEVFGGLISNLGVIEAGEITPTFDRERIFSSSVTSLDPFGKFPTVSPNGSKYSVKLGNQDTGRVVDRLTYTFKVPQTSDYGLILNYAVVLQNPAGHAVEEQPRFTVKAFNVTDNMEISCPGFNFIAASEGLGFKVSDVIVNGARPAAVFYKDWSTTTINLIGYADKVVRLEFTTNDCTKGGHFGYAYFDINEQCSNAISGNTYCAGQNSVILKGPRGFNSYKWYKENDMTTVLDTTQNLTVSPAPPDGQKYALVIEALPGLGCTDVLHTIVHSIGTPFTFKVAPVVYICKGSSVNLQAEPAKAGSEPSLQYNFYTDPVSLTYLRDPQNITEPGKYYIEGINTEGCSNILPVEVKFYDDVNLVINDPTPVAYPSAVDLSTTYAQTTGYHYLYYSDAKGKNVLNDYRMVRSSGKYYIKAISGDGCENIAVVNVVVDPPPANIIEGPTAFTPNNDGINDKFMININGYVDFVMLRVYNRNGQFMFMTKSQANVWDGNYEGKQLPGGTYYWLFDGVDQYWHTAIKKSGHVTIIR